MTQFQASSYLIKGLEAVICLLNQKLFVHCNYTPSECILQRGAGDGEELAEVTTLRKLK